MTHGEIKNQITTKGKENCALIVVDSGHGVWNDVPCQKSWAGTPLLSEGYARQLVCSKLE